MKHPIIYLDYAAATPLDKRVFKVMEPYFSDQFYNPSAPYQPGREVRVAIEEARAKIARILGAKPAEVIFTAGATESINLAFRGLLQAGGHVVVSSIDHPAVLETAHDFDHTVAEVDVKGRLSLDKLRENIRTDTVLVSIGMVNNEIGVVQDIKQIAALINMVRRERLARGNHTPLYFHTDATQAAGYLDMSVSRLGVDLLTSGAAKIYGPPQMGLLFKSSKLELAPLVHGGGHEQNLRSGTENVPGIIGFDEALTIATELRHSETVRLSQLKTIFLNQLTELLPDTTIIGDQKHASPHIVMVAWPGLDAERLLFRLEEKGVLVNTGAACAAKKDGPSHVLKALGLSSELMAGSLRLSFGRQTTEQELLKAAELIAAAIAQERA